MGETVAGKDSVNNIRYFPSVTKRIVEVNSLSSGPFDKAIIHWRTLIQPMTCLGWELINIT